MDNKEKSNFEKILKGQIGIEDEIEILRKVRIKFFGFPKTKIPVQRKQGKRRK